MKQRNVNNQLAGDADTAAPDRRALFIGFSVFAVLTLWVLLQVEIPMLLGLNPAWERRVEAYRWLLHLHACAGMAALLSGPVQFFSGARAAHRRWHRLTGRLYVTAVAVSASLGLWIGVWHLPSGDPSGDRLPTVALSLLWILCTGAGVVSAMRRQLHAHRRWLCRSYALTSIFVFSRLFFDVAHIHLPEAWGGHGGMLWLFTLSALAAAELVAADKSVRGSIAAHRS